MEDRWKLLENKIWITEEPADGAQASKRGSGLSNTDKQWKSKILSTYINVPLLYHNFCWRFCQLALLFSVV